MTHDALFALWFFVPAGIANATPVIVSHLPGLRTLNAPMDCGKKFHGKRILGDHKTWRGLISGIIMGVLVVWLQSLFFRDYAWIRQVSSPLSYTGLRLASLGLLLSFGALAGDAIESFLKRRCNIGSGRSWFPFDQLDYVIGGLLLSLIYVRLPAAYYAWVVLIWFAMHLLFSYIGYLAGLKDQPL